MDCFSKTFALDKPVASARLYATACGLYEARLGGRRVGSFVMAPGYTDYTKRIQYQTYDVKDMLHEGANELTCQLGDGWFRGSCGAWGLKNQYGTETKVLLQLEVTFADGSRQVIGTDPSWAWSDDGPIRQADNKDGEIVEAFRTPSYRGRAKVTKHSVTPSASNNVPVTEHETFHPTVTNAPNGRQLLDFGQNLAGYVRFSLNARLGQRMVWRFGEMLDEDGNLTQRNIQLSRKGYTTPLQRIDYTCGEGINEYSTTFAIFGFQYAEVEPPSGPPRGTIWTSPRTAPPGSATAGPATPSCSSPPPPTSSTSRPSRKSISTTCSTGSGRTGGSPTSSPRAARTSTCGP